MNKWLMLWWAAAVAVAEAQPLSLSPANARVEFSLGHLMSTAHGSFQGFHGSLDYNPAQPASSSVSWEVQASSIDTGSPDRDKAMRAPEYFDMDHHSTLSFQSTGVKALDATHLQVSGDFSMRGVTRSITVPVVLGARSFDCDFKLLRSAWGMTGGAPLVGDEVTIHLHVDRP